MFFGFNFLVVGINNFYCGGDGVFYMCYQINLLFYVCILFEVVRVDYIYVVGVCDVIIDYDYFVMLVQVYMV